MNIKKTNQKLPTPSTEQSVQTKIEGKEKRNMQTLLGSLLHVLLLLFNSALPYSRQRWHEELGWIERAHVCALHVNVSERAKGTYFMYRTADAMP